MASPNIPEKAQILVIGGGPGGSYSAAALAREGFDVVLLEASKFPRYHIGESMLPSLRPFMRFIDVEEDVKNYGFTAKPGAAVKLNQFNREGYTDFIALDPNNGAWNVVRSEFDDLLLKHASKCGARVFEETKVTEIEFSSESPDRPVAASWKAHGKEGKINFEYLVDASGRNGVMSTKYLRNRRLNSSLHNIACWGYWTGASQYMPGTSRENAIWVEALTDESGWAWFIPLHDGTVSVGIVMDLDISNDKKKSARDAAGDAGHSLSEHYHEQLKLAPGMLKLMEGAKLKTEGLDQPIKSASDFSYSASAYSGDHFRLVGDAAAFIDPFFSSGVHLAFTGGLSAASTISSSIRGECDEADASKWHNSKVGISYTRFLLVVLGAYKQIRSQSKPVMHDVDEDNFDRAFDLIRPVIQGSADVGKVLSEDELQKTMDFCKHLFTATTPEMHEAVGARLDPELMSPSGAVLTEADIDKVIDPKDEEAKLVLSEVNARKPIHAMYNSTRNFGDEVLDGYIVRVERGRLGLVKAP